MGKNIMSDKRTILVVEDEIDLNELYCEWLEHHDFEVIGNAKNGLEAIHIIQEKNPQYVILDTRMPDYDGYYVLKKLRELHKDCKIIIVSGCLDCNYEENEIIGILRKPCKLQEIKNIINNFEEDSKKLV